jgi:hypothetical protein
MGNPEHDLKLLSSHHWVHAFYLSSFVRVSGSIPEVALKGIL